mmetsp:Transcript_107149/g.190369  ORF Transcript_107149/g.190369 Transcript_107149/m.190369 type:complete len:486 (-) Transcript_107149:41-1498(-)
MLTQTHAARWTPRDFVEASQTGGLYTLVAYLTMLAIFVLELVSFLNPGFYTVMGIDESGSDSIQINFDVDVHDIECRHLHVLVFANNGQEKMSTWGEDFWLRTLGKGGTAYGVATKPQDMFMEEEIGRPKLTHEKEMMDIRKQDGEKEIDADWDSSHDGFKHNSFEHVIQGHDFTFINFFAGWCSHCMKFSPEWAKISEKVNSKDGQGGMKFIDRDGQERGVRMIKLNCVDFKETCREKAVDAYPSLRLYKADGSFSVYDGLRGEVEIIRWMERTIKMKSYGWATNAEALEKGCNAKGRLQVPRVPGHLEIMAGGGDQTLNSRMTNVSHTVKHLSFSDPDDGRYHRKSWSYLPTEVVSNLSPLDGRAYATTSFHQAYIHDLKVVSTIGWRGQTVYQFRHQGRVSTVPEHEIPQAQFHYDIEPFSVHVKQDHKKWYEFWTSMMAILGGCFVVMKLISRFSLFTTAQMKLSGKPQSAHRGMSIGHFE